MNIYEDGTRPSVHANVQYVTGKMWQDPIIDPPAPSRARAARVQFEPASRTYWHTHPLGQTLHILEGICLVQTWGGPIRTLRAGDTVYFAPGEKHWHGSTPTRSMVHLAIHEHLDGVHVDWLEEVTDDQYLGKAG